MVRQSQPEPFTQPVILLTRPQAQSDRFASALRQDIAAAEVMVAPLMSARFLSPVIPSMDWRGVVLTSETGAEAARQISATGTTLPVQAYCVGDRTASAAAKAGFTAHSAKGDAAALVRYLVERRVTGPLLHLCGQASRGDVANALTAAGIETLSLVSYVQQEMAPSPNLIAVLHALRPVLVPLFSPRSAALFGAAVAVNGVTAPLWVVAMSEAVACGLGSLVPDRLIVAASPDSDAMLTATKTLIRDETGS